MNEEARLSLQEAQQMLREIKAFKQTQLYKHFVEHWNSLYDGTVRSSIMTPLQNLVDVFNREANIGEARAALTVAEWFDELEESLTNHIESLTP